LSIEEVGGTTEGSASPAQVRGVGAGVKVPLLIIATIAFLGAMDYAKSLMLPVVLAFVLSLTLTPINMWLSRRIGSALSALVLVGTLAIALAVAAVTLSQPVAEWIDDAPRIGAQLRDRLADIREPVEAMNRASEEVEDIADAAEDPGVNEVVVREPGLVNRAATNIGSLASTLVVAIALTYFLLATNRLIYEKIVHASPKLSDKKRSLEIVNRIVTSVSKYLLTITMINAGFGVTIGVVFWALAMPNPVLWGIAAFFLNYLPFVGSLVGTTSAGVIALLTYPELQWAILPALAYFTITTLEGHFVTPSILGHRLELNPVTILLSIALWGFLWDVAGVILAVPILIIVKVICDNIPALSPFGEFLSGATQVEQESEKPVAVDTTHAGGL